MKKVVNTERNGNYITILFEGEDKPVFFEKIHGGLSWPSAVSEGYVCIFGQKPIVNKSMKKPITLLEEFTSDVLFSLFEQLASSARKFFCWRYYSDPYSESNCDFFNAFDEFKRRQDLSRMELCHPYITGWIGGLNVIREWESSDSLIIPKESIVASELGKITREDQRDTQRPFFPATSATCNVIGSFVKPSVRVPEKVPPATYFY